MIQLIKSLLERARARRRGPESRWEAPQLTGRTDHTQLEELDLPSMSDVVNGLPFPDWVALGDWVADLSIEEGDLLDEVWSDIALEWFRGLARSLGPDYGILRSPQFLLLHSLSTRHADILLTHCERALAKAGHVLQGSAFDDGYGPYGVIHLADRETFVRYADYYAQPGDQPAAGGLFIQQGYGHIVLWGSNLAWLERAASHELGHALLQHFSHPVWLQEALAMAIETEVSGRSLHHLDRELAKKHTAQWTEETIQSFWSGESFGEAGDAFELSYGLAETLLRNLSTSRKYDQEVLARFISEASYTDAGARATRELLGLDLGDVVREVLGPGEWAPSEQAIARYFRSGQTGGQARRDAPAERAVSIYVRDDRVYMSPATPSEVGNLIGVAPFVSVPWSQLGARVLEFLSPELPESSDAEPQDSLSPFVKMAGVRTWRAFAARATQLAIYQYESDIEITKLPWDGNGFSASEDDPETLELNCSASDLLSAVERVLQKQTHG